MACQWTDEQTGGHCPALPSHFTGTDRKWFTFTNGVAHRLARPGDVQPLVRLPRALRRAAKPELSSGQKAAGAGDLPERRWASTGVHAAPRPDPAEADYAAALAAFEKLAAGADPVRQRRRRRSARAPRSPGFEQLVHALPAPGHPARSWYLGDNGALSHARARRPAPRPSPGTRQPGRRPTSPATRARPGRPVDGDARLPLDAEPGRHTRCPTSASR